MVVLMVIYDISDDQVRNMVSSKLLKLGFTRVQKSVYVRRGTSGVSRYVYRAISKYLDPVRDRLLVLSIDEREYLSALSLGPKVVGDSHGRNIII